MEPSKLDDIDQVLAFARTIPDFPNKALVISRLEARNLNRYQEAILVLNESIALAEANGNSGSQLTSLAERIAKLEASDIVAE